MVDPSLLYESSKKFKELVDSNNQDIQNQHLRIACDNFTTRNVSNFLKVCQNQQTDVQNSELEEICLIAKMFKASEIYNKGVTFIQNSIDNNFFIPYNVFSDSDLIKYLILEQDEEDPLVHHINLNDLEFDESSDKIKNTKNNSNQEKNKKSAKSVLYQFSEDNSFSKRTHFNFSKGKTILFTAKIKKDEIIISSGKNDNSIENKAKNAAIIKRNGLGFNIVSINDQEFKIKFVKVGSKYSVDVTFSNNGSSLNWIPREPKNEKEIFGQYNRIPIPSKRNIILQSAKSRNPTFIFRKMSKKTIEIECHPLINPIIAFAIAVSHAAGQS